MAYVLGLIVADGAVLDTNKSSRTNYLQITSIDIELIKQVKSVLGSFHQITVSKNRIIHFGNKTYTGAPLYQLRIGNKIICNSLQKLGVSFRKSLTIECPNVPNRHFRHFLRGYFDGDGCLSTSVPTGTFLPRVAIIFTSGSKNFLRQLAIKISTLVRIPLRRIYYNSGAYRLVYKKITSLKILKFMYTELSSSLYLNRKYQHYLRLQSINRAQT